MDFQWHFPTKCYLSLVFSKGLSLSQWMFTENSQWIFSGIFQWNFHFCDFWCVIFCPELVDGCQTGSGYTGLQRKMHANPSYISQKPRLATSVIVIVIVIVFVIVIVIVIVIVMVMTQAQPRSWCQTSPVGALPRSSTAWIAVFNRNKFSVCVCVCCCLFVSETHKHNLCY